MTCVYHRAQSITNKDKSAVGIGPRNSNHQWTYEHCIVVVFDISKYTLKYVYYEIVEEV
jgi:hypothetical protein